MHFNRKYQNPNFDKQVAAKEEGLKIIAEIERNIEYADDTTEYEQIKKHVQTFEPTENVGLPDEAQRVLEAKFEQLRELAEILK